MLNKYEVIYDEEGKSKKIVIKAVNYRLRGTTYIFVDEFDSTIEQFEKDIVKDIKLIGQSNYH